MSDMAAKGRFEEAWQPPESETAAAIRVARKALAFDGGISWEEAKLLARELLRALALPAK